MSLLFLLCYACGSGEKFTPEELRLQKIAHTDTTLKNIILLDSIENFDLLATYEGCIGIKTGYTRQAGGCLASAASRDGSTLFLVLLNSRSKVSRFKESAILFDYGFNAMKAYRDIKD